MYRVGVRFLVCVVVALQTTLWVLPASAQTALDRVVGLQEFGAPVVISSVEGQQLAILAKAAGVSMGFEGTLPVRRGLSILATKRRLREVLDAISKADPRYEWREDDNVIVIRPVEAWSDLTSALHANLRGMSLDSATAGDALDVLARMVGVEPPSIGFDSRRFSMQARDGATWLEVLNAIVRAHGALTWIIEPSNPYRADSPIRIVLNVGAGGAGIGVPAGAVLSPAFAGYRSEPAVHGSEATILERIVGGDRRGAPIRVDTVNGQVAVNLANAAGVPVGFESLPAVEPVRWLSEGVVLSRQTLRQALDVLVALDPRYEWRDMDGMIAIRPAEAWLSSDNPLFRLVRNLHLHDVPASTVIAAFGVAVTGASLPNTLPDSRTFSVDVAQGTVFELLNAISRSHGEISWIWEEIPGDEKRLSDSGLTHRVTFWLRQGVGAGVGLAVP